MEKIPTHKVVAVDIDGVIIDSMQGEFRPEKYSPADTARFPTMKGCVRVMTRNGSPEEIKKQIEFDMKFRGFPFSFVSIYKPIADIYIDDRGWHFRDWSQMEKDLEMLGYFDEEDTTH